MLKGVRTNISSFLCLDNILDYINTLPIERHLSGYSFRTHLSGTGIFMSKDVVDILIKDIRYLSEWDDYNISMIATKNGVCMNGLQSGYNIEMVEMNYFTEHIRYDSKLLYYRVNNSQNRNLDIEYFKLFLRKIYNILL